MSTKPRTRYNYFNLSMPLSAMQEVRKECFALGISKQEFFRALTRDYFLRNHGKDIMLQKNERIHRDAE
jgi:hypothetical protein